MKKEFSLEHLMLFLLTLALFSLTVCCLTGSCRASGFIVYKQNVSDEAKFADVKPYTTLEIFPVVYNLRTPEGTFPIKTYLVLAKFDSMDYTVQNSIITQNDIADFKSRKESLLNATKVYPSLTKYVANWLTEMTMAESMISAGLLRIDKKWMKPEEYSALLSNKEKEKKANEDLLKEKFKQRLAEEDALRKELDEMSSQIQFIVGNSDKITK